jgi:4'-phosphopantetheinyl transferase
MNPLALAEAEPRIELAECDLDGAGGDFGDDCALLDPGERRRAAAFIFERDRVRFVRAHAFLRRRLGAFLGLAPEAVPIVAPDGAKPFVDGAHVRFSLSHSGGLAVLAVTADREVGIDLELLDRSGGFRDELDDLARACMTADEVAALADLPTDARVRRFLSFWTAKEARMKLTGEGLSLDPLDISLELQHGEPAAYARPLKPRAELQFVSLSDPQAVCCLATARDWLPPIR